MVCHEDLPHAQHLHHHGVVLEEDHYDVPTPRASGEVRAGFRALVRLRAPRVGPPRAWCPWALPPVVRVLLGLVIGPGHPGLFLLLQVSHANHR